MHADETASTRAEPSAALRLPAAVLCSAGLLSMLVMLLHPAASGQTAEARLQSLAAISPLSLGVSGMTLVVLAHGAWYCLLGGWLWRRPAGA